MDSLNMELFTIQKISYNTDMRSGYVYFELICNRDAPMKYKEVIYKSYLNMYHILVQFRSETLY